MSFWRIGLLLIALSPWQVRGIAADEQPVPRAVPVASPAGDGGAGTAAVINSMGALDDTRKLQPGDRLSFRVIEEKRPAVSLAVTDAGEVEVPLLGRMMASGKTCRQFAEEIKRPLERSYFYKATVIVSLDSAAPRPRGIVYITGQVRSQGPVEIPQNERFTLSKALMKAGGVADFGNKRKIKLVRKKGDAAETTIHDIDEIINKGRLEKDPELMPEDLIIVPERAVNF